MLLLPLFLYGFSSQSSAERRLGDAAYVKSMSGGIFYARCVPAQREGTKGTTKIYRVEIDRDVLVDSYDWYSPNGLVLEWSPIAGKVAVMSIRRTISAFEPNIALAFYIGGVFLRSYTVNELKQMGADIIGVRGEDGPMPRTLNLRRAESEQVPGTIEYFFSIVDGAGKRFRFNILTGERLID
jgi:hypothetical protein